MAANKANVPAFDSVELAELKHKLVTACHILDREGITDGYGHVSARIPGTGTFLTIANVSPGCATIDRLIMLDFGGSYLGGTKPPPNEWPIHACVMRARPDVTSVCHTHSKWSTLFSVLPTKLRPAHHYGKFLSAQGPPVYQAAGLVNTVQRGEALATVLQHHSVALMRAHGDTVVGESVEQAIQRTIQLSFLCELAHLASLHGEAHYLTEQELETFRADQRFPARSWEYYVSRLGNRGG